MLFTSAFLFASHVSDRSCRGGHSIARLPSFAATARWAADGISVAGGHEDGDAVNQLSGPYGVDIDRQGTVLIADQWNHRIVDGSGRVLAGGNGKGDRPDQLCRPTDVICDQDNGSLIISDSGNRRVTRWSRRCGTRSGETLIDGLACVGLAMDDEKSLYVTDDEKHEVRRYRKGETSGRVVAGGHGPGAGLHQLNTPTFLCVDGDHAVYVSDYRNHRVMKWGKDANEGIVVAGGHGKGEELNQLSYPRGLLVDATGTLYVADSENHRLMRWCRGAAQGTVVVGGRGGGDQANQFNSLVGFAFDRLGNLYVADHYNSRVQRFAIENN